MQFEHSVSKFTCALALLTSAICSAGTASADNLQEFSIPPQRLESALLAFSEQAGAQVGISGHSIAGLRTNGVSGRMTPQVALTQLIEGSDLEIRTSGEHSFSLVSKMARDTTSTDAQEIRKASPTMQTSPSQAEPTSPEETADPPSTSTRNDLRSSSRIEEVIVTAQKREERLIDVPQSVSVLSSDALSKLGAVQFRDFASSVPGLSFTTSGAGYTQLSLRGVTVGFATSPTVGVYVDEVPYGASSAFVQSGQAALDVGLFDVDRIEVLRGPQGTLYGASTMGGLLKYVTKRPDSTLSSAEVQTGISSTQDGGISYNAAAAVNAPIVTDKAALRTSGFYSHDGGYIDNVALDREDVNRSDIYGGRIDFLFTPTDAMDMRFTAFLQNISRDGEATADYSFAGAPLDGRLDQRRLAGEPFDQKFRLVSGTITYDLGSSTLTSISSYQTARTDLIYDYSRLFVPLLQSFGLQYSVAALPQELSTDKFVQEVRFAAERTGPFEWVIGGFYARETSRNEQEFALRDLAGQPAPNDLFTVSIPSHFEEYAAFGDVTWHLMERFDVTGGIRHARNRQKFTQIGAGLLVGSTPTRRSEENVSTYLANARYRFSDHATGYVRYATGYRPGGPNYVANDPTTGLPIAEETFDADRLKSYEIGIKAETADRRFGVDVAGFYIDWSDTQILTTRGGFSVYTNAPGGAEVRGIELAVSARPSNAFSLTGAFAYQNAELAETDTDLGGEKGDRLPDVPRFTAALNADYTLPVTNLNPTIGVTVRYVGERVSNFANSTSPQYRLPSYSAVDLRTGLTLGPVDLQLHLRNIFDERGELSSLTSRGTAMTSILQPRTISLGASVRF